jgi:hypothetical protein
MMPVAAQDLALVYRAVSQALPSGAVGGHHGPLETTAWIHIAIAELEQLDAAAAAALLEDQALRVLRNLVRREPGFTPLPSRRSDPWVLRRAEVGIADPAALVVAAHALARGGGDGPEDAGRLVGFAARRVAALNLVADASRRYLAGWWTARRFAARVTDLSPLVIGAHGHGHDNGDNDGHGHDDGHGHGAAGEAAGHDDACPCVDHEQMTSVLARHWHEWSEAAAAEVAETPSVTVPNQALYQRLASRMGLPVRALVRTRVGEVEVGDVPSGDEPSRDGAEAHLRVEIVPVSSTVVVGDAVHLWIHASPPPTRDHGLKVTVTASGAGDASVVANMREEDALVTLPAPEVTGRIHAVPQIDEPGSAQPELVPADVTVVAERPRCDPHVGGSWEIARVDAVERVEGCSPARSLQSGADRLRGAAAALLTGAYNAAVVGTQLCADKGGESIRECVKTREESVQQCTEERDEGYNQCTEERDEGYKKCCDWVPCSWLCDAWVWISNIVCVAWEWISNIVCVAWAWIKNVVCVAWRIVLTAACIVASLAVGFVKAVAGVTALATALGMAAVATIVRIPCAVLGVHDKDVARSSLKLVAVHSALLHTGKVLLMSYDEGVQPVDGSHPADFTAVGDSDRGLCAIWDPASGKATYTASLRRNTFCSHHCFLPDGRMLVAGGQFPLPGLLKSLFPPRLLAPGADCDVHVFDPVAETWERRRDMAKGRWYPTCVTLPDGRVLVLSGTNGYATEPGLGRGIQNTWEILDETGPVKGPSDTPDDFLWFHLYPFAHLLTDGTVVTHAKRTTRLFDSATSSWRRIAHVGPLAGPPGATVWPYSRTGPGPGTSVLLPLHPYRHEGRWDYPRGKVMMLGGGGAEGKPEPEIPDEPYDLHADTPATRTVEILDFDRPAADWEWRYAAQPMANGRVMPDSVLLPDGTVLVVGGGRYGKSGGLLAHFASVDREGEPDKGALDPVLEPELFDPATETWRPVCPKPIGRLYHTTVLLLADGRVLVGGHDGALNMAPYDQSRYELEIFSPPYLFAADGTLAPRPQVSSATDVVAYGADFELVAEGGSGEIRDVALIRPSSLTHQINTEQRYVGLPVLDHAGANLRALAPPTPAVAVPGWYLLFVVDTAGTPSVGHWIRLAAPA